MPLLHGYPTGLLDLVGAMNRGETPREMGYVIQPTLELRELYLASKQQAIARTASVITNGPNTAAALQVPVGEVWAVHFMSMFISTGAGEAVGRLWLTYSQDGTQCAISPATPAVGASSGEFVVSSVQPFIAHPGTRLGVFALGVVGVPTWGGYVLASRLKA